MKRRSFLSLSVIIIFLFTFFTSCKIIDVKEKNINPEDLIGTWQLCHPDGTLWTNVFKEEGMVRYKSITPNSFSVTHINLIDKKVVGSFLGSCTLENNIYTENIKYKDTYWENIPLFKGETHYKIYIKDDLLYIEKINGSFKETWRKLDISEL
jgi:hypothetical protein